MKLPVEAIRRRLDRTETGLEDVTADPVADAYRAFYGLDFPADEHRMGYLLVDGERIFVQSFRRGSHAQKTVCLLHGYLDHSGLQGSTISRLLDLDFTVIAIDHVGHGLSSGNRASVGSFQTYVDSLGAVINASGPIGESVLMGHSLGAAVAMTYMLQHPDRIACGVLVAPLFRPKAWPLIRLAHKIAGPLFRRHRRLFRQNTHDADFLYFIEHVDPLSPRFIPHSWIDALFHWIDEFRKLEPVATEVLVLQGTDDGTVDGSGNWNMIKQKFPNASQFIVQDGKHQLLNELDSWRAEAWTGIERFLGPR